MRLFPSLNPRRPAAPDSEATPRVLVACPDHAAPAGGVRQLYRLVEALRSELRLDAHVYHQRAGFRPGWFRTTEPVLYADTTAPGPRDLLVLPETWGGALSHHPKVRKIIFNQNAYYAFQNGYSLPPASAPLHPRTCGVVGILTVSDDNAELLRHVFPDLPVERLCYAIDPALFRPAHNKPARIAYMPRKHPDEARQVLNILALRGALEGFEITPIEGVGETETAGLLRSSLMFLSFGYPEGFSLPPAEAMACGCLTVGYHGRGAREFLRPPFSWPIETGDILGYVRTVEELIAQWRRDPAPLRERAAAAADHIHRTYSPERHRATLRQAWTKLVGPPLS